LEGDSQAEAMRGVNAMIEIFEHICLRLYGPRYAPFVRPEKPNKAPEPTPPSVTDRAGARSAPAGVVAHL
jgi:hypothetical protein